MSTTPDPLTPQGSTASTIEATAAAAALDTSTFNVTRDLAGAINEAAAAAGGGIDVIKGVVTSVEASTFTATLNGDTVPVAEIRYLDSYSPVVGDVVAILKLTSNIFCLGQYNNSTGNGSSANGWQTPTLGSGFTTSATDPVMYRKVVDNGDTKIQMRGAVSVSGTPTALWTMPSGYIPGASKEVLIARDDAGGSNAAKMFLSNGGAVTLTGPRAGLWGLSAGAGFRQTSVDGGSASVDSGGVKNNEYGYGTSSRPKTSGPTTIVEAGDTDHIHFFGDHVHVVTGLSHQHDIAMVSHPTTLSFNGVEYFL